MEAESESPLGICVVSSPFSQYKLEKVERHKIESFLSDGSTQKVGGGGISLREVGGMLDSPGSMRC